MQRRSSLEHLAQIGFDHRSLKTALHTPTTLEESGQTGSDPIASPTTLTDPVTDDQSARSTPTCSNMSTHYIYHENGDVTSYIGDCARRPFSYSTSYTSFAPMMTAYSPPAMCFPVIYPAGQSAYNSMCYPTYNEYKACHPKDDNMEDSEYHTEHNQTEDNQHHLLHEEMRGGEDLAEEQKGSYYSAYSHFEPTNSTVQVDEHAHNSRPYAPLDVEQIRKYHDLHSLLGCIPPQRLQNAMYGPTVDIVEDGTGAIFAYQVPKKMLVLFCGRAAISKLIRTLERQDNENWAGGPTLQELRLPRAATAHVGIRIMVAWMQWACQPGKMGQMWAIPVPKNLFAAICLARALNVFGLHRDACRVDRVVCDVHLRRPLHFDEIRSIWLCLPRDSTYTYRLVTELRTRLIKYKNGHIRALPDAKNVLEFLEANPELNARIGNPGSDKDHEPVFGIEWIKNLPSPVLAKTSIETPSEGTTPGAPKLNPVRRKIGILRIVACTPEAKPQEPVGGEGWKK